MDLEKLPELVFAFCMITGFVFLFMIVQKDREERLKDSNEFRQRLSKIEADEWMEETTYTIKNRPPTHPWLTRKAKIKAFLLKVKREIRRIQKLIKKWYMEHKTRRD